MNTLRTLIAGARRTVLFAAAAVLLATAALAQSPPAQDEAKVKAGFLLRFAQFVAWPEEALPQPDTPLVVGLAGAEGIAGDLSQQAVTSRATLGRPVIVRTVKVGDDVSALHVLFVGMEERLRIAQYAGAIRGEHILLVTESPGALDQGSMINFVVADRRVKFEIALDTAEKAGLVLSSRLLAVAIRVLKSELRMLAYPVASAAALRVPAGVRE